MIAGAPASIRIRFEADEFLFIVIALAGTASMHRVGDIGVFSQMVPEVEPRLVLSSPDPLPRIDAWLTYSHDPTTTQSH